MTATNYAELVERLRAMYDGPGSEGVHSFFAEAASAIRSLRTERDALKRELAHACKRETAISNERHALGIEIDKLRKDWRDAFDQSVLHREERDALRTELQEAYARFV